MAQERQRWRGSGVGPDPTRVAASSRLKKVFWMAAAMLALVGIAAAWLFYVRPMAAPFFLTLAVREYTSPELPVNPLAVQDADVLLQHFPEDRRKKAYESQTRERLRLALHELQKQTEEAIVVHICALARSRDDDVYLLPGDADPGEPKSWLSLKEVLESLRGCHAPHKLLILDIMRPLADARLGVLADDIGSRTLALLEKENLANLLVLCACGKDQLSLMAEDMKLSAFAYYLDQGLRGSADGMGPHGRLDRRVTVKELAAFVEARVDRWARQNRAVAQTPVLLGGGEDFPLVQLDQSWAGSPPELFEWKGYPAWIKPGWELHDKWWADDSFRLAPRIFRELEAILLRTEERWLGGIEEARLKPELKKDLEDLSGAMKKAQDIFRPRPFTLALVPSRPLPPPGEGKAGVDPVLLEETLRGMMPRAVELTAKPADLDKTRAGFLEKFKTYPFVLPARTSFAMAGKLPQPSAAQIQLLVELLQAAGADQFENRFVETIFLQQLVEFRKRLEENEWTWPATGVQQALRTLAETQAALAVLAEDPFSFPWVSGLMQQAEDLRRQAEKNLLSGPPSGWEKATALSQQAQRQYQEVRKRSETLRRARRDVDEATVVLPALVPFLLALPQVGLQEEAYWKGAIGTGKKLGDFLAQPNPNLVVAEELDFHADLRQHLRGLRRFYQARMQRFLDRAGQDDPRDMVEFQALRVCPLLTKDEREKVWQTGRSLAKRLQQATQEKDRTENEEPISGPPSLAGLDAARKVRRASLSLDLLRLGGFTGADSLQQKMEQASGNWQQLGEDLREAWTKKLPGQFLAAENNLSKADRLSRILPAFSQEKSPWADPGHWSFSPATSLSRQQAQTFWHWLGNQYRAESRLYPEGSVPANFFAAAAEESLR